MPRVNVCECSEADVGSDAVCVLWDVYASKNQVVFRGESNGVENASLTPASPAARNERREALDRQSLDRYVEGTYWGAKAGFG